jgi:regulator of cell morphogenesis and NO signaling
MHCIDPNTPLEQFLSARPELMRLFDNLGINSRCDESQSLAEVCQQHALDLTTVARLLRALPGTNPPHQVVTLELMTLSELCDHLEHAQRVTIHDELTCLDRLTHAAVEELGEEHPQLLGIRATFVAFREKFAAHLREETEELFPLIRQLTTEGKGELTARSTLKSCLTRMESEHNQADEALAELRALAGDESVRRPVPVHMRTVSDAIVRLKHAVHEQIYKENQVLFPRALAIGGSV